MPAAKSDPPSFEPATESSVAEPQDTDRGSDLNASASKTDTSALGFWAVFASTFVTIAIAEMGDKTQVATLLLSAESHHPLVVFVGAGTALVATSLLGVLLGSWLGSRLSPRWIERGAAIVLLFLSASLFWEIFREL